MNIRKNASLAPRSRAAAKQIRPEANRVVYLLTRMWVSLWIKVRCFGSP